MLEQYCCEFLRNMCCNIVDNYNQPLVRFKNG